LPDALAAARWDDEYRRGRYADEPPLPFVGTIVDLVRRDARARDGVGLYVGCGNGRNYVPLVDAGLDLRGLDVSSEALDQLTTRRAGLRPRLHVADFREFEPPAPLAYVIAIQVFQHGTRQEVASYFARVAALLAPRGLFFLRVNSAATQVGRRHTVIEHGGDGGFSVRYLEGPKAGVAIHFYSRAELEVLTRERFETLVEPREEIIHRAAPERGFWAQWEAVYRRR
jgi:cyclopropane fatty-acyl-phospholipid synthase-like methyltransferase